MSIFNNAGPNDKSKTSPEYKHNLAEQIAAAQLKSRNIQQSKDIKNSANLNRSKSSVQSFENQMNEGSTPEECELFDPEIPDLLDPVFLSPPESDPTDLRKEFGILTLEEQRRCNENKSQFSRKEKRNRAKTGRDNQVKTRLSDAELLFFRNRVEASGMKQGDFMRACLLKEEINTRTLNEFDELKIEKLMEISSELGRIGGLIKGTVMANKDNFKALTPQEKNLFERDLRELIKAKNEIQKVVQEMYGNS